MELRQLIEHPEMMSKETLYDLRQLTALHPYYQTARLLMLQNLYLLHDSSFDEELRRAAIFITDRTKLFDLVEARHYRLRKSHRRPQKQHEGTDRTMTLIDDFLNQIPDGGQEAPQTRRRKPTAADATVDYVAYLLETDDGPQETTASPTMQGQDLIDKFINDEGGKIQLKDNPEYAPATDDDTSHGADEGYFTATLARIYVKQKRYSKALEIIKRLNLNYPKKSAYFADQIRFLEKLIINNNNK